MPADTPEEIHALLSIAMNSGDLEALVALYEDDATLAVPPEGRPVTGRDAIRDATAEVLALRPVADMRVVGKLQHDGLALTYGRWRLTGTDPSGAPVELAGRGTMVSRRQLDGRWLNALEDTMSPP
jgi:ketosteroid isomerase-like protein